MALELKSYDLKIKPLRWSLVIASILIAMFAPGDMAIIPDSVQSAYLVSRFGIQIPVILLYLAFSYTHIFKKYAQLGLLMAGVTRGAA